MAITTRTEQLTAHDGGQFDGHLWVPDSGSGPGLLLLQEIFGVGPYIRSVAERLAIQGYVVLAPDVFWRIQPNWEADHDEKGLTDSIGLMGQFDFVQGVDDCVAAFEHLDEMSEVQGGTGVIGFCMGGLLTYHVAAATEPASSRSRTTARTSRRHSISPARSRARSSSTSASATRTSPSSRSTRSGWRSRTVTTRRCTCTTPATRSTTTRRRCSSIPRRRRPRGRSRPTSSRRTCRSDRPVSCRRGRRRARRPERPRRGDRTRTLMRHAPAACAGASRAA